MMQTVVRLARAWILRHRQKRIALARPPYAAKVIQRVFRNYQTRKYLRECAAAAKKLGPAQWAGIKWPKPGRAMRVNANSIKMLCVKIRGKKFWRALTPEKKRLMHIKAAVSDLCGKKKTYAARYSNICI